MTLTMTPFATPVSAEGTRLGIVAASLLAAAAGRACNVDGFGRLYEFGPPDEWGWSTISVIRPATRQDPFGRWTQ